MISTSAGAILVPPEKANYYLLSELLPFAPMAATLIRGSSCAGPTLVSHTRPFMLTSPSFRLFIVA
jgi:hypothetical protein